MKSFFTVLFLGCSVVACCQEKKNPLRFGLKLGLGLSTFSPGSYTDNSGFKHSFSRTGGVRGGLFLQIDAGKKFLFQPELLMAAKGSGKKTDYNNGNPLSNYPIRVNYIEIPLNLLVKLPAKSGFLILGGGPAPAFSTNKYTEYAVPFDMGVNLLLGYQLPIGFLIHLNFTKGFSNILEEVQGSPNLKNNSLGLSVGYAF